MIVLIGSQKGGCGKSTTAVNLCAYLAQISADVVLVDSDRQGTASNWAMDRAENITLPKVHCVQKYENIRATLLDLNRRYEIVVVDAAGRDSRELRTGMTAADILIIPFRTSQPDLDTLPKMDELIGLAKDINPTLSSYALLTMASPNPVVNETREAANYIADYPQINLIKVFIRDRKVYRDAMSYGKGVTEMENPKAKLETQAFVWEVLAIWELKRRMKEELDGTQTN